MRMSYYLVRPSNSDWLIQWKIQWSHITMEQQRARDRCGIHSSLECSLRDHLAFVAWSNRKSLVGLICLKVDKQSLGMSSSVTSIYEFLIWLLGGWDTEGYTEGYVAIQLSYCKPNQLTDTKNPCHLLHFDVTLARYSSCLVYSTVGVMPYLLPKWCLLSSKVSQRSFVSPLTAGYQ